LWSRRREKVADYFLRLAFMQTSLREGGFVTGTGTFFYNAVGLATYALRWLAS
jgi:hypothetical protein